MGRSWKKFSLLLSPMNVLVLGGSLAIFLVVVVTYIIAFTSLQEYILGYADVDMKHHVYETSLRLDSLESAMLLKDRYLESPASSCARQQAACPHF